jgi:hypothetical protein
MRTYGLILCHTAGGWSLHAPFSGKVLYVFVGVGAPTQDDYDRAHRILKLCGAER